MEERSAVILEPYKMELQQFPIPDVQPDGLLLRVEMTAICGSDRRVFKGTHARGVFPVIPGHEVVGWVEAVGDVAGEAYDVRLGDRIGIEPYILCKSCRYCLQGHYQLCKSKRCYGINMSCSEPPYIWGGYGEYMYVAPNSKVHKIDAAVPAEAACLSSVIGNGIRWVREKGQVRMGESVAVCGPGAQGLATVIAAKESGADPIIVLGVTQDAPRFELAKALGATHVVDVLREDACAVVRSLTGGEGTDVVVDCTGSVASMQQAVEYARPLGRCVFVGLTEGKPVPVQTDRIVYKELTIRGGVGQPWDVEDAVRIINSQRYPIERMITHRFPLERAADAMSLFMLPTPECVRVVLVP